MKDRKKYLVQEITKTLGLVNIYNTTHHTYGLAGPELDVVILKLNEALEWANKIRVQ